jgi:hypothetical protein
VAFPKADQLVFDAICSTADTIYFSLLIDIVPTTTCDTIELRAFYNWRINLKLV